MRLLGVASQGETASASDISEGLTALNAMLQSWSLENMTIFQDAREVFDLIPGKAAYSMGPDADFDTVRPVSLSQASIEIQGDTIVEMGLGVLMTSEFNNIAAKALSGLPTRITMESTVPNATVSFWPVPSVAYRAVLYTLKPLLSYQSVNEEVILPPGYERALQYNLAVEISPEYGKDPSPIVFEIARESKANIKRINMRIPLLRSDVAVLTAKGFNILTGE